MNADISFTMSLGFLVIGMLSLVYLVYGRVTKKPLIGDYASGKPGHKEFLLLVNNNKFLIITVIAVLISLVSTIFEVFRVIDESHSSVVFVAAPVMLGLTFITTYFVVPRLLKK